MLSFNTQFFLKGTNNCDFLTLKSDEYSDFSFTKNSGFLKRCKMTVCALLTGNVERVNKVREVTGGSGYGLKTAASLMHRHSFH